MNCKTALVILAAGLGITSLIKPASAAEGTFRLEARQASIVTAQRFDDRRDEFRRDELKRERAQQEELRREQIRQAEARRDRLRGSERRVWIPGHYEAGFLGIGRKWVEGHWEDRR